MEQLKKVISLNQAAKISGYSQDYLGFLIRQGSIKGQKVGRNWVTTESEVLRFVQKQKIGNKTVQKKSGLSPTGVLRLVIGAAILVTGIFSLGAYVNENDKSAVATTREAAQSLSSDLETGVETIQ